MPFIAKHNQNIVFNGYMIFYFIYWISWVQFHLNGGFLQRRALESIIVDVWITAMCKSEEFLLELKEENRFPFQLYLVWHSVAHKNQCPDPNARR